jgi:ABC-type multidrug transport system fused ATPase/permease subunit
MYNTVKNLIKVLTRKQKIKLLLLQFLIIISAVLEVVTILIFGPFMALIGNTDNKNIIPLFLINILSSLGIDSNKDFIIAISFLLLIIVILSSFCSIVTIRKLSYFAAEVGSAFGDRLYNLFMSKNYLYHSKTNSAEIIKKIATDVGRVTDNILQPIVQINARIATVIFLSVFILLYNTKIAVVGIFIISATYFILFRLVKNRLSKNGNQISITSKARFKLLNEGFNAIKEVQILGRQDFFISKFNQSGKEFAESYGSSNSLYNTPRYIIEFILYFSMLLLILFFVLSDTNEFSTFLSTLAVFGIASLKLLPSFQQMYSGLAQIRSNVSAFDSIHLDLIESFKNNNNIISRNDEKISGDISLKNAFFSYSNNNQSVINGIDIHIPLRSKIGIVGPSGSGKSTLMDILMGSISPSKGKLFVGDSIITNDSDRKFRNNIGYVSQSPLMLDGTIAENIAVGISLNDIDYSKLSKSANVAQLTSWIDSLPDNYETIVGERGVKISGGQRQRIAIARAFYNDAEYLFFDEATSSLDTITENSIMKTIDKISEHKTIIMIAHRLSTVKKCDKIYIISDGKVKGEGTYNYLLENNKEFSIMAGN